MNGITGRMGKNQHLLRSIVAIIKQGGVKINEDECIMPDVILVGRNMERLQAVGELSGIEKMTTNLDEALAGDYQVYFDAQVTGKRFAAVEKAIAAGKHIY